MHGAVAFVNNSMVIEDGDRTLSGGKAGNSPEPPHPNLIVLSNTSHYSTLDQCLIHHLTLSQYLMIHHTLFPILRRCMVGDPQLPPFTSSSTVYGASLNVLEPPSCLNLGQCLLTPSRKCLKTPLPCCSIVSGHPLSLFHSVLCLSPLLNSRK